MSPLVEAEANTLVPNSSFLIFLIHARLVTLQICDLICAMLSSLGEFFSLRRSQSLITLSTDPTARYLELGEKAQVLRLAGFSLGLG